MTIAVTQSPLLEAQADSLNDLFRLDPLELSESDLDRMVDALREFRGQAEVKRETRSVRQQALSNLSIDDDLFNDLIAGESK